MRDLDDELQWSSLVSSYGTPDQERILPQFEQFAAQAFAGNSIVYALVSRRISVFSEAVFKYRSLTDKHLFGTPDLEKLENPWPNGSTGEMLARMEQDSSLAGNSYIRDAGSRLERLRPDWVTIISWVTEDEHGRKVRDVIGYLFEPVGDPDRGTEFYPVEEVVHWSPMPDPLANFRGMSWLTPVIRDINADVAMTAHREAFFRNAATPNMIIKYQQKLAPTQRDQIRDAIAARHAGNRNAFGTMVLDQGADMTVVGDRMQGSAFSDLQAAGEVRLAAAAGVPAIVAGLSQGRQTGAPGEYADAVRGFVDLTIRPNWRTVCSALTKFATPPPGSQLWFDTTDISALRQGEKDAADTMQVQAGTTNTLIMAGYEPDAVVQAVTAGDLTILAGKHSGLTSVQMHAPGEAAAPPSVEQPAGGDAPPTGPAKPAGRHRSASEQPGAMIALLPAATDAARLSVIGGEPADELHLTLVYLGFGADFNDHTRSALTGTIGAVVADVGPVVADGFALSVFNPGDVGDRQTCIVLGLAGDELAETHGAIERAVSSLLAITGPVLPVQPDPWAPHVALLYTGDVGRLAELVDRVGPITFDRVRIAFAGDSIDIPLIGD